jgi:hypothetical protein
VDNGDDLIRAIARFPIQDQEALGHQLRDQRTARRVDRDSEQVLLFRRWIQSIAVGFLVGRHRCSSYVLVASVYHTTGVLLH